MSQDLSKCKKESEILREEIVKHAKSMLDAPYRWNGVQPERGSHCATFGLAPYKMAGLIAEHTKLPIHHRDWMLGKEVDPNEFRDYILRFAIEVQFDDRQSADLVTFMFRGVESHCGIITDVDPDWFVHQPSGSAVKFDRLLEIGSLKSIYRHKRIVELENGGC